MIMASNDPKMYEMYNKPGPVSQVNQGRGVPSQSYSSGLGNAQSTPGGLYGGGFSGSTQATNWPSANSGNTTNWPGANQPTSVPWGRASSSRNPYSGGLGPRNPWQMFSQMNRMGNRFNQRPQPNQNQYSNPTPGQNPMMGPMNPIMNSRMPNFGSPNIGMPNFNFGPSFNPNMPLPNKPPMIGRPTPDVQGYYGGYRDAEGVNHPGNQPGMSYIL